MQQREFVVVGGGAMGLATAWHLARAGRDVVVIEQFTPQHGQGSSHGGTRIFRLAHDDVDYVKLAQASLPLWRDLEEEAQVKLLDLTGAVDHGPAAAIAPRVAALDACGVAAELLRPDDATDRWPGMRFDESVLFHPGGGRIHARATLEALENRAEVYGAEMRYGERVEGFAPSPRGLIVRTHQDEYEAATVVVTAGAWVSKLVGHLVSLPAMEVTQEQTLHFRSKNAFEYWPSFLHHTYPRMFGLETPGEGVKVAEDATGPIVDPDDRDFMVDPFAAERVCAYVAEWMPGLDPHPVSSATCLYTTPPSHDFIIDRTGPLVVVSPCSGAGFKFAPAVGKIAANLATGDAWPPLRFRL